MNHLPAHQTAITPDRSAPARADAGGRLAPGPVDGQGWRQAMEKAQIDAWFAGPNKHGASAAGVFAPRAERLAQPHADGKSASGLTLPFPWVNGVDGVDGVDANRSEIGAQAAYRTQAERSGWHTVDEVRSSSLDLQASAQGPHVDAQARGAGMPSAYTLLPQRCRAQMSTTSTTPAMLPGEQESTFAHLLDGATQSARHQGLLPDRSEGDHFASRLHSLPRSSGHAVAVGQVTTVGTTPVHFHAGRTGNRITLWLGIGGRDPAPRLRALQIVGLLCHALSQQGQALVRAICNGRTVFEAGLETAFDTSFATICQPTSKET